MKYVIERWTGKAWYTSLCSPYKNMSEVNKHLRDYSWHYTTENPYRIKEHKEKKKAQYNVPKFNFQDWNSDQGMVVKI
jgi:hypothetical protein